MVRNSLGLKAPRRWGWITNPRRVAYNRIYNRATVGLGKAYGDPAADRPPGMPEELVQAILAARRKS